MNLDLLNNFVNPWEAGGALTSQALETPVLEGNVLEEGTENIGVYVKFSDESSKKAFKAFFATEQGKTFVKDFAKKGQSVYDHTFENDGKYYLRGIDLTYLDVAMKGKETKGGDTDAKIKSGRLKLKIRINTLCEDNQLIDIIITIVHESLLHVYEYVRDFQDNGKIDYSHDPLYRELEAIDPIRKHHHYFHKKLSDERKNKHPLLSTGFPILEKVNEVYNLNYSRKALWELLWNFWL